MDSLLGLDVGSVRIGVAKSCPLFLAAMPLEVIDRRRTPPVGRIVELANEFAVSQFVVGYPLRLQGDAGPAVVAVENFVALLAAQSSVPVVYWDERLSTGQAERMMIGARVRRAARRQNIDKIAACLILQSFMDAHPRAAG